MTHSRADQRHFRTMPTQSDRFLIASALLLILAGLAVFMLGASGRFLPHDEQFLGMTAQQLCALRGCRVVHFMIHDRIAFGGATAAVGLLYLWLALVPLPQGHAWAWWLLLASGLIGFSSFFGYLGYGYLDTWHALFALGLFPCYLVGLLRSARASSCREGIRCLFRPSVQWAWRSPAGLGRACLLATAGGLALGGLIILIVGTTCVFVPQDLAFMGLNHEELQAFNPRLVPLIAHDRAGFGGAVCSCGVALFFCGWCGTPSAGLWRVLGLVGVIGFGPALGAHPAVGYNDPIHLAPAVLGVAFWLIGMVLTCRPMAAHTLRTRASLPMAPTVSIVELSCPNTH
jgi:hypothetical protein